MPDTPSILQHVPFPEKLELQEDPASRKAAWKAFQQVWVNYEISSGLNEYPTERRTTTLLTCFSSSALKVFNSLTFTSENDKKDIHIVLAKMDEACRGETNTTYERYLFNTRAQGQTECIDNFYSSLREMSLNCDFGALADSLIRDRIVVGIRDSASRKRLLYEKDLSLTKCLDIARSFEATQVRLASMKPESQDVHFVKKRPHKKPFKHPQKAGTSSDKKPTNCQYCGKGSHARKDCPASNAKCFKCKKRGHFTTVCKSTKNADQVDQGEMSDNEEVFLGAISTSTNPGTWTRPLSVDTATVTFKIDTGADVSILPFMIYQEKLAQATVSCLINTSWSWREPPGGVGLHQVQVNIQREIY